MYRLVFISFIFILSFQSVFGQLKESLDYYKTGYDRYSNEDYTGAAEKFSEAILIEIQGEKPAQFFLGDCYKYLAFSLDKTEDYKAVPSTINNAINSYRLSGKYEEISVLIPWVAEFYNKIKSEDYEFHLPQWDDYTIDMVCFRVSEVYEDKGDTLLVKVDAGELDGIIPDAKGKAIATYSKSFKGRSNTDLGTAEVISLALNFADVLVILSDPDNLVKRLYKGDMIELPAKIPKREFKSIFYDLALLNIDFLNISSEPLYHFRHVAYFDSEELESDILRIMKEDIWESAEMIRPMIEKNPSWGVPLDSGRFKGLSLVDIMDQTKEEDVYNFLRFVRCFPGKYMGTSWKINETYGTWIINFSPISSDELLELLLKGSLERRKELAFSYESDIVSGGFYETWNHEAEDLAEKGKFNAAYEINALTIEIAELLNDSLQIGWGYFYKAEILGIESNFLESIEYYKKAIAYFKELNELKGLAFANNNMGNKYNSIDQYDNAIAAFSESVSIKQDILEESPDPSMFVSISNSYTGLGECYYYLGNYLEALEEFQNSLNYSIKAKTTGGLKSVASVNYWLGKTNQNLGNYEVAASFFDKQYQYYLQSGDLKGQADALDNIAFNTTDSKKSNELYQKAYEIKINLGDKNGAGFSKSNVGQTYWTLGEYEKAIEAHKKALKLREEANNISGQAYSYRKLGGLYKASGDPKNAIINYDKSIELYQKTNEISKVAEIYTDLGETYFNVKDYSLAETKYKKAINIFDSLGLQDELGESLFDLASVYFEDKKYEQAFDFYSKSLKVRRKIGDKTGQSYSLVNMGLIERIYNYDFESARKNYHEGIRLAIETNNEDNIAYAYRGIGFMFSSMGAHDSAIYYRQQALDIYKKLNDRINEARLLLDIGYSNEALGEFELASQYYNQAFKISEEGNDRLGMASALTSKGGLSWKSGDYEQSLKYENQSLEISIEVDNKWGIASSFLSLGNIYHDVGEYQKAIDYYLDSDSLYKIVSTVETSATPINNIGSVYYWQGDYIKSLKYFFKAYHMISNIPASRDLLALITGNIGASYQYLDMIDSSKYWLNKALPITIQTKNKGGEAMIRLVLVRVYFKDNSLDQVASNLERTMELCKGTIERALIAKTHTLYGKYYHEINNNDSAESHLLKSIKILKAIDAKRLLWEPLYYLAINYKDKGLIDSSLATMKEAIEVIEYLKNQVVGGEDAQELFASGELIMKAYETIVELLLMKGDAETALLYLEKGNSENLNTKFKELDIIYADETKNEYLKTGKELKGKIELINAEIEKEKAKPDIEQSQELINKLEEIKTIAQNDYRDFFMDVIKKDSTLKNYFIKSDNPVDFKAQRRNIPDNMAVLLYLLSDEHLYIFAGTRDSVFAKDISISKTEVEQKVMKLYDLIKYPSFKGSLNASVRGTKTLNQEEDFNINSREAFKSLSADLYKILIQPVENEIADKKNLAIIPNGVLYYLPFQVLGSIESDSVFNFISERFALFYTNKLNYLYSYYYEDDQADLMAVGNADNTLPFAEAEVKALEKLFDNAVVLVRDEATKENVFKEMERFNILHLATHGILNYNDFDSSYLVLASDSSKGDDGRLMINEIFRIRNIDQFKLVTLSACETAVSMELLEGWPVNTASVFLEAGVPSVIASLWKVDDKATSILMEKFYSHLKTMNTLEAIQKAQLEMSKSKDYNHPYYWAPFLLVGSWK